MSAWTRWLRAISMRSRTSMMPSGMGAPAGSSRSSAAPTRTRPWRRRPGRRCARPTSSTRPWTTLRASWWTWRSSRASVTGEEHDTARFTERLGVIEETLGASPDRITADTIYGVGRVFAALEDRQIEAVIPPLRAPRRKGAQGFPTERFKFDPHHDVARCPAKKRLTPRNSTKSGRWYRADRRDCVRSPLKAQCLPQGAPSRRVHIVTNHAAILRARRKRAAWGEDDHAIYTRHRWRVEGAHGTAKTLHGLARAIRRGLENMKIQALMTAIAMNLKKLAAAVMLLLCSIIEMRAARPNPASA